MYIFLFEQYIGNKYQELCKINFHCYWALFFRICRANDYLEYWFAEVIQHVLLHTILFIPIHYAI